MGHLPIKVKSKSNMIEQNLKTDCGISTYCFIFTISTGTWQGKIR